MMKARFRNSVLQSDQSLIEGLELPGPNDREMFATTILDNVGAIVTFKVRDLRIQQLLRAPLLLLIVCTLLLSAERALALDPGRSITQYVHDTWRAKDGLPQSPIDMILQTRDGFLWLATRDGLVRFDGLQFTTFNEANTVELKSNDISVLLEDGNSNLWIGTNGGGLTRFKDGAWTAYSTEQGLPHNVVSSLYEDVAGTLWIGTEGGVARLREDNLTTYTTAHGLPHSVVRAIAEDGQSNLWVLTDGGPARYEAEKFLPSASPNKLPAGKATKFYRDHTGDLWILTIGGGLGRLHDGDISMFTKEDGLVSNFIFSVQEDKEGGLWIGTGERLAHFADGSFSSYGTQDGLAYNIIDTIYQDREGALWLGTSQGGLSRYVNGEFKSYGTKQGLLDSRVSVFYEDQEGDLWVSTDGGLERFRNGLFSTYTTEDGLSSDSVMSLYGGQDGSLWIGTYGGGLDRYRDGKFTSYAAKDGLSNDTVWALCEDRKGGLWIGTDDGLNQLSAGRFTHFTMRDGLSNNAISSLFEARDGTLWIGTYGGGLNAFRSGVFKSYTTAQGLSDNVVLAIYEDQGNRLWIGTETGLDQLKDEGFVHYTSQNGRAKGGVFCFYEDENHCLWMGTHDGLTLFRDGRFTSLSRSEGLLATDVTEIMGDDAGNIWIGSGNGVHRAGKGELEHFAEGDGMSVTFVSYGEADGMKIASCNGAGSEPAGWKTVDGRLWFATHRGLSVLDPNQLKTKDRLLAPKVVSILFDYQPIRSNAQSGQVATVVPAGTRMLQIHYTAPSFDAPEKIRFKYRLEGFDRNWVDAGTERTASFTNLAPGDYRFRIAASSDGMNWHEASAVLEFYIQPRFYQTYWFYALCAMLLALVAWLLHRLRVRRIEAEFGAVLTERNRMAREIHDTLAQGFVGISFQLELVAKMMQRAPEVAKEHLDNARDLVRSSLEEARRSVRNLRAQSLETAGLVAALADTGRRMTAGTEITAEVETLGQSAPLSGEIENSLFRIGQEALTNALKHAQARHIRIQLCFEHECVQLRVTDDGRGFDPSETLTPDGGGFGFKGMHERAAQLGAKLEVNSQPCKGTEIVVRVPTTRKPGARTAARQ
jgi:ligand-binding sensor domain-containing protein/signal transduction histidine kinase